jgi:hypothetical protein
MRRLYMDGGNRCPHCNKIINKRKKEAQGFNDDRSINFIEYGIPEWWKPNKESWLCFMQAMDKKMKKNE